jgi:hypothetical protein
MTEYWKGGQKNIDSTAEYWTGALHNAIRERQDFFYKKTAKY